MRQDRNIILIGFMGTGKTSVGTALAKSLGRDLVDVDRQIERRERRPISDIFEKEGEAYFRKLEKEAIREVSQKRGAVITTGGGAVLDAENLAALQKNGVLVSLTARPETIFERVRGSRKRPLLNTDDMLGEIKRLLEARSAFYQKADLQVETDRRTPAEAAAVILELLERVP